MNIVYLAHFAGSPEHGMVHAYYHLAREWVKSGHQVTIIAASYAHPRHKQPDELGVITEQWLDGVRYLWLKTPAYKPENYAGRVRNIFAFVMRAWLGKLPVEQADLVICSSHHPFAIFPARKLARKFHARLVFEVRDLWPLSLIELGQISPRHPFIWLMQKTEDYAYRHADKVVSVLSGSKNYMIQHGMAEDKFCYMPNGAALDDSAPDSDLPETHQALINQLKSANDLMIGFAGRVNLAVGLEYLVEAIREIKDLPIKLFILGDGEKKAGLQKLVRSYQLEDKIYFLPAVTKSQVHTFLLQMDVVYLGLQKQPLFRFGVSPTKLNDYMYAAKPVIYAIEAPDDPVAESGCGISCQAENAGDIAEAIKQLLSMSKAERTAMGDRGYRWLLNNRNYGLLAKNFIDEAIN